MIPFGDSQQRSSTPYVTRGLLIVNILVFLYMLLLGSTAYTGVLIVDGDVLTGVRSERKGDVVGYPSSPLDDFTLQFGATPEFIVGYLTGNNASHDYVENHRQTATGPITGKGVGISLLDGIFLLLTPLTAMFLHGGWFHVIGNMLFLWVFGDNVEDRLGSWRFAAFYFISGYAAAAVHIFLDSSDLVPMIGASGAISAVLGAYLLLFPRSMIRVLIPVILLIPALVPAPLMIGVWFALNLISGLGTLGAESVGSGGTAWFAHLGGFLAGIVLIYPFLIGRWRAPQGVVGPIWGVPPGIGDVSGFWGSLRILPHYDLSNSRPVESILSFVVDARSKFARCRVARYCFLLRAMVRFIRRLRRRRRGGIDIYRNFGDR